MRAWFMLGNKLAVAPLTGTSWYAMQHAPRCVIVWLLEVIDSCCYDLPRRFSDRQVPMRSFVLASHDVGISFDSKIVQFLRSETESKQFCVPKTRPTRIHRPMKSMTFETDEILHFGDMYQAKRPFLEIHRTDESDEIDEI